MLADFKGKKKRERDYIFIAIAALIFLVCCGFIIADIKIYRKKQKYITQIENLQKQVEDARIKNENLKANIENMNSQQYVEDVAREELGFKKQGENVVAFVMPESENKPDANTAPKKKFFLASMLQWISQQWNTLKARFK